MGTRCQMRAWIGLLPVVSLLSGCQQDPLPDVVIPKWPTSEVSRAKIDLHPASSGREVPGEKTSMIDTVCFGNEASESAHQLTTGWGPVTPTSWVGRWTPPSDPPASAPSDVITGAFGQTARRLLPRTPNPDVYGGEARFVMAVNPLQQNYFTMKWWGSDPSGGRWFILDVDGLELGQRHGGDSGGPAMFNNVDMRWAPNRFIYRTVGLPFHLTRGRTNVMIRIRSLGWLNDYDPNQYFGAYQKLMKEPSMALYRAYTHTGSWPDTEGEQQGNAPALKTPRTVENEADFVARVKANVNGRLAKLLRANPDSLSASDLKYLAECFDARENLGEQWILYPAGHSATTLVSRVIDGIDAQVTRQSRDDRYLTTKGNDSWGGYFGPVGDAVRLIWKRIKTGPILATQVDYGGRYGRVTRRQAWSKALRESVDHGRFHRRVLANQELYCANNIYRANRGILLLDPSNALREAEALRYVREAAGMLPFKGNDRPGGGVVPVLGDQEPYDWFVFTTKGTSKEFGGFVGSDYGELAGDFYALALLSGDKALEQRAQQMFRARAVFRFPGPDADGYLVMQAPNPIGLRNNTLPGHFAYLGRGGEFHAAMQGVGKIGKDLLGYYQQAVNDGQLFQMLGDRASDPYMPMRYATIKAMPQTGIRLPMSVGAPDFAWVDEENLVVAAKHGEERFFANLLWGAPEAINGWAKVFHLTEERVHFAEVQVEDVYYRPTGQFTRLGPRVEKFGRAQPPDSPTNAFNGVILPVAMRSDLAVIPASNPDGGRGTGYTLRYGHWLVGINAHHAEDYRIFLPSNFTTAMDLVSGRVRSAPVVLPPKSSAVFYLPDQADPAPRPARPMLLRTTAAKDVISLSWSPTPAARRYNVKRASAAGGPYEVIAAGIEETGYLDRSASRDTSSWYVVSGLNERGEGADSVPVCQAWPRTGLQNRAPLGEASASSQHPAETADRATDGDVQSKWYAGRLGGAEWLQVDFGKGLAWAVRRYAITSANDIPERDPRAWRLEGSDDGATWSILDRQSGQTFATRFQTRTYDIPNRTGFRYFRLNIESVAGGSRYGVQLADWALLAE